MIAEIKSRIEPAIVRNLDTIADLHAQIARGPVIEDDGGLNAGGQTRLSRNTPPGSRNLPPNLPNPSRLLPSVGFS